MISRFVFILFCFSLCDAYSQNENPFQKILGPKTADIKAAAEKGDAEAQCKLAQAYYSSFAWSNSVIWFKKSAKQGNPEAQYSLGKMLIGGSSGVPKNVLEGIRWLRLAANQNHSMAQMKFGEIYEMGEGLKQDYVEAYKWYLLLVNQSPIWRSYPDRLALKMTTVQIDEAKKRVKDYKPAKSIPVETEIKLQGIMGSGDKRLAMIGGKAFQKGEQSTIKVDDELFSIKCLEIGDATANVQINGKRIETLFLGK